MKVLYLIPQPKRGGRIGAYTFLDEEIQAIADAGVETYVLAVMARSDRMDGRVRMKSAWKGHVRKLDVARFSLRHAAHVPFANLLQPGVLYHATRLEYQASAVVREEDIDLVHSHFAWPEGFGGALTRADTGRPLVASLRGTDVLIDEATDYGRRREPAFARAIDRLLPAADRTIYFSRFMRDHTVALGAPADRARVVRKGVNVSRFRPVADRDALKARLGLPPAPLILSVGGLIPRKGVDTTLEALARLRPRQPLTFVVCGEGPERARLEGLARQLGVADVTRLVGVVDRAAVADYFSACDLLVHAPVLEAAGNVLFEAMASGRPVVCTEAGGPEEYVEDGRTGFVVPPGDPAALAGRLATLLGNAELADRMGAEGLRQSRSVFTYERMTRDIISVYEETLASCGRRAS